jgi:hypothetical protein
MAKNDKAEESVQDSLKSVVKEIVAELVAKLVKASAKNAVAGLKKRLKEKALRKLEEKLKETTEEQLAEQLSRQSRQLQKAITEDNPSGKDYVSKLKQGFEQDFDKFLSSFRGLSALATTLIISLCILVIAIGGVVFCCFVKPCPTQSEPQPDLVVTGITFQMEPNYSDLYTTLDGCTAGYQLVIYYTVENQGDAKAGQSTGCIYLNDELVAEATFGALAVGESAESDAYYYPFLREAFLYYICCLSAEIEIEVCADCGQNVVEADEANNCTTLKFGQTD